MDSKGVFGYNGLKMEHKNQKESLAMVKEIVFGRPGIKMVIKNYKLHIMVEN